MPMKAERHWQAAASVWQRPSSYLLLLITLFFVVRGQLPWGLKNGGNYIADPSLTEASPVKQVVNVVVWLLCLALLLPYTKRVVERLINAPTMLAIPLVAVASMVWSQFPLLTASKSMALLLGTLFAGYIVERLTTTEFFQFLQVLGACVVVLSVAWVVGYPSYGINNGDSHGGSWEGIFVQKNIAATTLTFLFVAFFIPIDNETLTYRWFRRFGILCSLCFIVMTRSVTGVGLAFLTVLLMLSLRVLRRFKRRDLLPITYILLLLAVAFGFIVSIYIGDWFAAMGRDLTFSGRTDIWKVVIRLISLRPLTGYGYGAFWVGLKGRAIDIILTTGYAVGYAHNGFLDVWLQVGFVELCLVAGSLLYAARTVVRDLFNNPSRYSDWYTAIVILTILFNLDEETFIMPNSLLWMMYVMTYLSITKQQRSSKLYESQRIVQLSNATA